MPAAWYSVPFFWHRSAFRKEGPIIGNKSKVKISFPRLIERADPAQASGSISTGEVYGFTWILASLVTSCIGRCCESFAFCCTIEIVAEPGAIPLITMPSNVPLPLTPAVLGCRVVEMMDWPFLLSVFETMAIS